MATVQDFLVLLDIVLLLMILHFLMEINRAVQHSVTRDNNERRAVRRLEFIRNVQGGRRENENLSFPPNRNRPTENDERQG